jgi:hypothetical protein
MLRGLVWHLGVGEFLGVVDNGEEEVVGRTPHNLLSEAEVGDRDLEQGAVGVGPSRAATVPGDEGTGWHGAGDATTGGEGDGRRRRGRLVAARVKATRRWNGGRREKKRVRQFLKSPYALTNIRGLHHVCHAPLCSSV